MRRGRIIIAEDAEDTENEDEVFNEKVDSMSDIDLDLSINDGNREFLSDLQPSVNQLIPQARFIDAFQQPRTDL